MSQDTLPLSFSTFGMDKLGKVHGHHWKERLKISKIAKFESASLRGGGTNLPPTVQTFVNFRDFAELLYLRSPLSSGSLAYMSVNIEQPEHTVKNEISLISCPYIGISK